MLAVLYPAALFPNGVVVELRIPKTRQGTVSGYFDNLEALARCAASRNGDVGVYVTLNPCNPALLARRVNRIEGKVQTTTADKDIVWRIWLLVDFDPVRPSEISSSDAEHTAALERARTARFELSEKGWPQPVFGDSGNGAHLLYRIDLDNDDESAALLERVLKALAARFDDDLVKIDTVVFNAARIAKLYGTVASKGDSTADRPHRLSRMLEVPQVIEPVSRALLEEMAASVRPAEPAPKAQPNKPAAAPQPASKRRFNIDDFVARHLDARAPVEYAGGRKWILNSCPFGAGHQGDAAVYERADGTLGFKCFHNSCAGNHWKQLRALFEPAGSKDKERPPRPEPGPEVPDGPVPEGDELVKHIEITIRKYVVLPERAYLPVAIWIIATHTSESFESFPYIALLSAAKRSGKTRTEEVLETMVRRPWRGAAPSPAALYRMLETAPTLLCDEIESLNGKNKSETAQILLAVLNVGHRKGATIPRCEPPTWEVKQFVVYGPKVFAAIRRLPDTLVDRSIVLHMKRRTKKDKVTRFRQVRATAEAKPLHDDCVRFVKARTAEIEKAYQQELDSDLDFLNDRDADLWAPLFAMCRVVVPERRQELERCALALSQVKAGDDADESYALTLLADIRTVWPRRGAPPPDPPPNTPEPEDKREREDKCETVELLKSLKNLEESPWLEEQLTARKLARMLRPFEVEPRNIQIEERRPKGYLWAHFQDAFSRYLEELPPAATAQPNKK
jgi:hypothetical protein